MNPDFACIFTPDDAAKHAAWDDETNVPHEPSDEEIEAQRANNDHKFGRSKWDPDCDD